MDQGRLSPATARRQLLTLPGFIALSGLLAAMLAARPEVMDPDFWWHLRNGRTLLALSLIHIYSSNRAWVTRDLITRYWG